MGAIEEPEIYFWTNGHYCGASSMICAQVTEQTPHWCEKCQRAYNKPCHYCSNCQGCADYQVAWRRRNGPMQLELEFYA